MSGEEKLTFSSTSHLPLNLHPFLLVPIDLLLISSSGFSAETNPPQELELSCLIVVTLGNFGQHKMYKE